MPYSCPLRRRLSCRRQRCPLAALRTRRVRPVAFLHTKRLYSAGQPPARPHQNGLPLAPLTAGLLTLPFCYLAALPPPYPPPPPPFPPPPRPPRFRYFLMPHTVSRVVRVPPHPTPPGWSPGPGWGPRCRPHGPPRRCRTREPGAGGGRGLCHHPSYACTCSFGTLPQPQLLQVGPSTMITP